MNNIVVSLICFMGPLLALPYEGRNGQPRGTNQSCMHKMQYVHPDHLTPDQQVVFDILSPLYKRIYLYALDEDQKEMVAVFQSRGENPYHVIDNILLRDRERNDADMNRQSAASISRRPRKKQKKYTTSGSRYNHSEQKKDTDYQLYYNGPKDKADKQSAYEEKSVPRDFRNKENCRSCNKKKDQYQNQNTDHHYEKHDRKSCDYAHKCSKPKKPEPKKKRYQYIDRYNR